MKKRIFIVSVLLIWAVSVWAVVEITLIIPDEYVNRILDAFNTLADTHITIKARGSAENPEDDFAGKWDFRIAPKEGTETNVQFSKRFTKELVRACVRCVEFAEDTERYRDAIADVNVPDVNVPDGIIE